jgi:hypothetical protein
MDGPFPTSACGGSVMGIPGNEPSSDGVPGKFGPPGKRARKSEKTSYASSIAGNYGLGAGVGAAAMPSEARPEDSPSMHAHSSKVGQ